MNRRAKINRCLVLLVTVCLIPCLVGCDTMHEYTMTGSMWDSELAAKHHEAATNANFTLSRTIDGKDVLAEYNEANERNEHLTRRAFLVYENEKKVEAGKRPHFISASKANKLRAAPVEICSESNAPPAKPPHLYAVISTNGTQFTIVVDGFERGPYTMPVYMDARGKIVRAVLTPATVTCDVVIWGTLAATVVGLAAAYLYVASQPH